MAAVGERKSEPGEGAELARLRRECSELKSQLRETEVWNRLLRSAIDNRWDATIVATPERLVHYLSPSLERILGYAEGDLAGRNQLELIHPDDLPRLPTIVAAARESPGKLQEFKIRARHKRGDWRWLEGTAHSLEEVVGLQAVVINCHDVTERESAREADRRLAAIIESSHDAVGTFTLDGIVTSWNSGAERIYGFTAQEIVGRHVTTFVPAKPDGEPEVLLGLVRRGEAIDSFETVHRSKSGRKVYVSLSVSPLCDASGEIIGGSVIARDMTAHREAEERLRQSAADLQNISRHILLAQETERANISRELHDQIGQALVGIKMSLRAIESQSPPEPIAQELRESIPLVERALEQVRNLSFELRPSILDDLGFMPALRTFLDRLARRHALRAHFHADSGIPRLTPILETTIYRVAQEALTNVARHANAANVWVDLRCSDDQILLEVRDDGSGFEVGSLEHSLGPAAPLGLLSMEERSKLIGGQVKIESVHGEGTVVSLCFPLPLGPEAGE